MVEELEIGLENLGLQDEDVEIADADADSSDEEEMAEREARKSLGHMPKYEGRTPWRSFETQFENWRFLNAINDRQWTFRRGHYSWRLQARPLTERGHGGPVPSCTQQQPPMMNG